MTYNVKINNFASFFSLNVQSYIYMSQLWYWWKSDKHIQYVI